MTRTVQSQLRHGASVLALSLAMAGLAVGANAQDLPLWQPYVDIGGRASQGRDFGAADLYVPIIQDNSALTMLNIRGIAGEDDYGVGDIGAIYRRIDRDAGIVWGANAFASVSRTENDNTFWHASLGAEVMTEDLEARGNLYLPLTDPRPAPIFSEVALLPGNQLRGVGGQEHAMHGVDAEIGYRLPILEPATQGELRVFGGAFYFDEDEIDEVLGVEARLEYRAYDLPVLGDGSRFTAYAGIRDQENADEEFFVGGHVRFALNQTLGDDGLTANRARELTDLERRMEDPLYRRDNPLVVGGATGGEEMLVDPETGVMLIQWVEVDASTPDLQGTVDSFGANTLVLVNGDSGAIPAGALMNDSQTWLSGGATIPLTGASTGMTFAYTGPGSAATVSGDFGAGSIRVQSNDHLAGFTVTGNTAGRGVFVLANSSNVSIQQTSVSDVAGDGIFGGASVSDLRIFGNTVSSVGGTGIGTFTGSSDILISGNSVTEAAKNGIGLGASASDSTIIGNTVAQSGVSGIQINNDSTNIRIANNTITDSGSVVLANNGIGVGTNSTDVVVENNVVARSGWQGISFAAGSTGAIVRGNTISESVRNGVYIQANSTDAVVDSNRILGLSDNALNLNGIYIDFGSSNVQVTNNSINALSEGEVGQRGTNGIVIASNKAFIATDFTVANNEILNFTLAGVNTGVLANGTALGDAVISNNVIDNTGLGIVIGNENSNVQVLENKISNVTTHGVQVGLESTDIHINMNMLSDIGDRVFSISTGAQDIAINDNLIYGTVGGPLLFVFSGGGDTTIVSGTGNTFDLTGGPAMVCDKFGGGAFTVSVDFDDISVANADETCFP
ncbi:MAG: right-handed parallel beta-helix repeat-containing protein [Azospirillaceae bacterium]